MATKIKSVGINPIYEPVYEGKRQDVSWNEETVIGFDDVVATDKHIYTLLNGAKGKQLKSNPSVGESFHRSNHRLRLERRH